MANLLGMSGAQPSKPTRFAPIYTGRWLSGIWTNRSPLRDATTTRLTEKFYGPAGDALIAGSNVEVTPKLTLARRPGNSVFDSNSYTSVNCFYDFRLFSPTDEEILIMIDQANALYAYNASTGTQSLVWTKSTGAGQTYMQSVGNTLFFANGVDNKKWLQSLASWSAGAQWNTSTTPYLTTFLIDLNGNIQQLMATVVPVTSVAVSNNVLTVGSSETLTSVLSTGMEISFPAQMNATFLENQTVTITAVSTNSFTASFETDNYTGTETGVYATEATGGANPTSGTTEPTWSTTVPSASNNFQGGITVDGMVKWVNRGSPVQNWGIAPPVTTVEPVIGTSNVSWQANTFYSLPGVTIDSNGNLQQVTGPGKSGTSAPTWATTVGSTTTDGTVTWKMIQTAASLTWQPHTSYTQSIQIALTSVAASSGGSAVYSGAVPTSGASNGLAGKTFVVTGWSNVVNNGVFTCTASSLTSITLSNASAVAETNAATATSQGTYLVANAYGTNCLFALGSSQTPSLTGAVSAYLYNSPSQYAGAFSLQNPTSTGSALASATNLNSLSFTGTPLDSGAQLSWNTVNAAGETTGTTDPFPTYTQYYQLIILASLNVPVAGTYSFTINHHDGMIWGIGNGAVLVSGTKNNTQGQTITAAEGYPVFGGSNVSGTSKDSFTVTFPTAGTYPLEIDYCYWYHSGQILDVLCNGFPLANISAGGGTLQSGTNPPIWPSWSTSYAPNYPSVTETNGQLTWLNLGLVADYAWSPGVNFTLPNTTIIDPNGYTEAPYRAGVSGTTAPTFSTGANQLTLDQPNLIWINQGKTAIAPTGTVSTFNGGWQYCIALVNSLDETVSNATPLGTATGNFVGVQGITIPAGAGLPNINQIDPQCDYVAIFRTTDGESTPFLIPGQSQDWTISLASYLANGYVDTTPDTGLNNLESAPLDGENTPPPAGAKNLTYHLSRLFFSVNNVVSWTSGPDSPVGNGLNGVAPLNYDENASLVTRIVPTTSGALVFTVSDIGVITGQGTATSPIQPGITVFPGVGLSSYNALDVCGSIIGFFSSDRQFIVLTPGSGLDSAGIPLGDQFRLNTGTPGQSWNPRNVYVAWHVDGEDQGWYVADGQFGWYRLLPTPAPESGYTWCPFATIQGGCGAIASVEVTPGVHKLLLGPTSTGSILARDLTTYQDNGTNYSATAVVGSAVLAQPGQIAVVSFITTESVNTGTPLTIGLLIDEALPYYTGPIDVLTEWTPDPPGLKRSRSLLGQRFYLAEIDEGAACRHMQMQVTWAAENAANELLSLTVFGAYEQEN